jgi:predicted transcriptional regulator
MGWRNRVNRKSVHDRGSEEGERTQNAGEHTKEEEKESGKEKGREEKSRSSQTLTV